MYEEFGAHGGGGSKPPTQTPIIRVCLGLRVGHPDVQRTGIGAYAPPPSLFVYVNLIDSSLQGVWTASSRRPYRMLTMTTNRKPSSRARRWQISSRTVAA